MKLSNSSTGPSPGVPSQFRGFSESHPLQRIRRDSEVASRHAGCNPAISAEVYGRALLGFTSGVTSLV